MEKNYESADEELARFARGENILNHLDQVDYCAEIWGQYFGGIARAVVEQYAGQLYVLGKDQADTSKEDQLAAIRTGFLRAFGED